MAGRFDEEETKNPQGKRNLKYLRLAYTSGAEDKDVCSRNTCTTSANKARRTHAGWISTRRCCSQTLLSRLSSLWRVVRAPPRYSISWGNKDNRWTNGRESFFPPDHDRLRCAILHGTIRTRTLRVVALNSMVTLRGNYVIWNCN